MGCWERRHREDKGRHAGLEGGAVSAGVVALADTVLAADERGMTRVPIPSVDTSLGMELLPPLLSIIAGSVDAIGFLGLGGLFTAHVTGNLVILAAHLVSGGAATIAPMLSVPVFILALGLTRLGAAGLESVGRAPLHPLLLLQFLLLGGFLALCVFAGPYVAPNAPLAILAGMLGVSAVAVQNALVQIALKGAPSTAVMTTNITRFMMDVGGVVFGHDAAEVAKARSRAKSTWPAILGFAAGCGVGAACDATFGLRALALPTGLALLAFAMGRAANLDGEQGS
jgi:uncharacterized membrane protein YoaK (UPF0700 family)